MCLAVFAVNYDVMSLHSSGSVDDGEGVEIDERNENVDCEEDRCIKLKGGLGNMHRRKQQVILQIKRYKVNSEPEKYYHAKHLLYFLWHNDDELINGFSSYHHSYLSKQETIQENAKLFNDDCELFDLSQEDLDSNTMQTS